MKTISDYRDRYRKGAQVEEVIYECWQLDVEGVFIHKASWDEIQSQINNLTDINDQPLYGVPYLVKDNIDVAGMPTTAACPAYAYEAIADATVVARLRAAGAICLGKTNLDQFATGLVGVRTPYPTPKNAFDVDYLPGGSSCGSAVGVAKNLAAFSLGTDTAGSGRVPAAFNELVGLKPTRGYLSTRGVVDACKSLDCVSVFAHHCADADLVLRLTAGIDREEAWSRSMPPKWSRFAERFRFAVPMLGQLNYHGWDECSVLFEQAAQRLEALGGIREEVDMEPFMAAAKLLYEGPWVSERYAAIEDFLKDQPDEIWPVTRSIIEGGSTPLAVDAFKAQYRLAECKRLADQVFESVQVVILPTTPRNFTVAEVEAEPVKLNSILGSYTNFMNLLDFAALALPAGRYKQKLPWGITMFGPAGCDRALLELGSRYEMLAGYSDEPVADIGWDEVELVVCGAHLSGMALNHQLEERGASLIKKTQSAPSYKMYLIPASGGLPQRPAMVHVADEGAALEVEVWRLSVEAFGDFVSQIPQPLGIGKVELVDGSCVCGFIAEARASLGAEDITEFAGWRNFIASQA